MTAAQWDMLNVILGTLVAFVQDPRTVLIGVFIALDFGTGVMAALRTGTFDWRALATFYKTEVLPYGVGYALLYTLSGIVAALMQTSDPQLRPVLVLLAEIMQQLAQYGGWLVIIFTLGNSILRNLGEVRTAIPKGALRLGVLQTRAAAWLEAELAAH